MISKLVLFIISFLLLIIEINGQELTLRINPETVIMSQDEYANYEIELKNVAQKDFIIYSFYIANILDTNYVWELQHIGLYIALTDSAGNILTPDYVVLRQDSALLTEYENPYHIYTLSDEIRNYGDISDGKAFFGRQILSTRRDLSAGSSLTYNLKDDLYSYNLKRGRYKIFALFGIPDYINDIIGEEMYNAEKERLFLGYLKSNEINLIVQ